MFLFVHLDVKPEFPLPPIINPSYLKTGDNVTISNCIYHSPYQIHKSDWRKDGVVLKNVVNNRTTRQRRSVLDAYPNLPGYIVEDLHIQNVKLANQGYYQCSVQDGGTTTSSGRVHLKLQGLFSNSCCSFRMLRTITSIACVRGVNTF